MPNDGERSSWNGHKPFEPRHAGPPELRARADELREVHGVADSLARIVGVPRHQSARPCGTMRSVQSRMANRSVIPAR